MNILGFELFNKLKKKKYPLPDTKDMDEYLNDCLIKCNNQMRGVINERAKVYNEETLEFYFGEIFQKGMEWGMDLEKRSQELKKL